MEELRAYLKHRYAKETAKAYQREIEIYLSNCPGAEKAGYKEVFAYLGQLRNRYPNPKTIRRILSTLKVYYDYLNVSGRRTDNPTAAIRLRDQISSDIQLQDFFTPGELEQLLHKEERYALLSERNKVLMSLLIYQGLQPRELAETENKRYQLSRRNHLYQIPGEHQQPNLIFKTKPDPALSSLPARNPEATVKRQGK
jgi:integrase/recombinase XerD